MTTNIFTLNRIDDAVVKNINIDELYEKKRQKDLNELALFNKILSRIHTKIKMTSRQRVNNQCCWFIIPDIIIGVPHFDHGNCVAFVMNKLIENGFRSKYYHPNTLFISWNHWVPSYVRSEIKKKYGVTVTECGDISDPNESESNKQKPPLSGEFKEFTIPNGFKSSKNFADTMKIRKK